MKTRTMRGEESPGHHGPISGQNISESPAAKFARRLDAEATALVQESPRLDIRSAIIEVLRTDAELAEQYRRLLLGYSELSNDEREDRRATLHEAFAAGATSRGVRKFLERM